MLWQYLCSGQEIEQVYDIRKLSQHKGTGGRISRIFWLCRAYKCTSLAYQGGEDPQWLLEFGLILFSQCTWLYPTSVN